MSSAEDVEELISDGELERRLLEVALDGEDVRNWLVTPAGKAILRRAKTDYMDAAMALVDVDLGDPKALALQMKARVAVQLVKYVAGALRDGESAAKSVESLINEG